MARLAPHYQVFVSTHRHRERDAEGKRRRYWTGVLTFLHKELLPNLEAVPLKQCCLNDEQQAACAGRVIISCRQRQEVAVGDATVSQMHYFIN
eukprot:2546981-Rhodomonas_salina.1